MSRRKFTPRFARNCFYALACVAFFSCATLFNSRYTPVRVVTSVPTYLVVGNDTMGGSGRIRQLSIKRSRQPLILTAYNDSLSKQVVVNAGNSFAYWLNAYPSLHLWTGFYIDTRTGKRYTYPKTVYIDVADTRSDYLRYVPVPDTFPRNIIKLSPLRVVDMIHPGIEFAYERKTAQFWSTQVMASCLLPRDILYGTHSASIGFRTALEERFYLRDPATLGPYAALEVCYLKYLGKAIEHFETVVVVSDTVTNYYRYQDSIGIDKSTTSINFKIGHQWTEGNFVFEIFAGMGARYRVVKHHDRIRPADHMEVPRHPNIHYAALVNGDNWILSLPVGLKLGWRF